MSIEVSCAHCGHSIRVKDEFAGKRGKCPNCQGIIAVPQVPSGAMAEPTGPISASKTAAAAPSAAAQVKAAQAQGAASPQPAAAARAVPKKPASLDPAKLAAHVLGGFQGNIEPTTVPVSYQLGIAFAALVMVLLPLVYVLLIGLVGYGICWYAVHGVDILSAGDGSRSGRGQFVLLLIYAAPLISGVILIIFMLKPLFVRPEKEYRTRSLTRDAEPLLFAFVDRICQTVGAPQPTRIDINLEVNASASFRRGMWSMLGDDLVLTIGLPLVAGLNLRQFAGVMAHEFGHFSQGAGMRLSFLVRTISYWFTRVVYHRDEWDRRLQKWAEGTDLRIGIIFHLSRFFVWLTRKMLWVLMMLGHIVAGYLMRQMEFDADRYEARLAGSETFAKTCRQLHVLGVAAQGARSDLNEFYQDGRLADDFPKLIMANVGQLPEEVQKKIDEIIAESETGLFDTHPADSERIANAAREAAAGIFQIELPATVLFTDFTAQAKMATLEYYHGVLDENLMATDLYSVDDLLERQGREQENIKAARRYFQDMLSPLRPYSFLEWEAGAPSNPQATVARIGELRKSIVAALPKYRELFERYDKADTISIQAEHASALLRAGLRVPADAFAIPFTTRDHVENAQRTIESDLKQFDDDLAPYEVIAAQRLIAALRLLYAPKVGARIEEIERKRQECDKLIALLETLGEHLKKMTPLRNSFTSLGVLLNCLEGNEENALLKGAIFSTMENCLAQIQSARDELAEYTVPIDHAKGEITVAQYLVPHMPEFGDLGGIYDAASGMSNGLWSLYLRTLGRLAVMAEQVEKLLGMPPLPEPKNEEPEPIEARA